MKLPFSPSKTWWTIVALLIVVGVFLYGLSQGMLWPLMYASTILVGILLFIAVSLDHSWGALAVVLFNVLGTLLVLGVIGAVLFPNLLGIVIALIGFGMLQAARRASEAGPLPRSNITARTLLPPQRKRGATLISVIVAMGIVAMTMTLALRAHYQGSRFVALEQQRTVAAAECHAQLERARARGFGSLPAIGEHPFASQAGEGTLIIEPGPVDGSRRLTARLSWPGHANLPAGSVELDTIMSARGVGG